MAIRALYCIGDVHGRIPEYQKLLATLPPGSRSIALGDLYLGRRAVSLPDLLEEHKFIRGNHDDPDLCRKNPNYLGDFGYLADHDLFFLSGAQTASWRVLGNSKYWYRNEELSDADLEAAITLYAKTKPRALIAHEFPQEAIPELLRGLGGNYFEAKGNCINSRTPIALQRMVEIHRPERFFGGHYHISRTSDLKGTRYKCLRELEICEVAQGSTSTNVSAEIINNLLGRGR
jgi:hypothetical protein